MSNTVYIKRKPYTKDPRFGKDAALVAEDKHSIGGAITMGGTTYKGLTFEEEKLLMPLIIGIPASNPDFILRSNEYFDNMKKRVPVEGLPLNIALQYPSEPLSADNMPENVHDYILYKYVSGPYKHVAKDIEELNWNNRALFYIFDPQEAENKGSDDAILKLEATREFAKIMEKEDVINMVIKVLSGKTKADTNPLIQISNPETMSLKVKQPLVMNIAMNNSEIFLETIREQNLEKKAEVYDMISKRIIEDTGASYVFSGREIGKTIDQAVAFISSNMNSDVYLMMKGKLESMVIPKAEKRATSAAEIHKQNAPRKKPVEGTENND